MDGQRQRGAGGRRGSQRAATPMCGYGMSTTANPLGRPLAGHTLWVSSVAFSPDGHRLPVAGGDGKVQMWNLDTGQPMGAPLTHHFSVHTVAFSSDGHTGYQSATRSCSGTPWAGPSEHRCAGTRSQY